MLPSRLDGEASRRASNKRWGSKKCFALRKTSGGITWDNGAWCAAEADERKEIVEGRLLFVRTFEGSLGRMICKAMQIKNEILWQIPRK
jgi:hypothetical protein